MQYYLKFLLWQLGSFWMLFCHDSKHIRSCLWPPIVFLVEWICIRIHTSRLSLALCSLGRLVGRSVKRSEKHLGFWTNNFSRKIGPHHTECQLEWRGVRSSDSHYDVGSRQFTFRSFKLAKSNNYHFGNLWTIDAQIIAKSMSSIYR